MKRYIFAFAENRKALRTWIEEHSDPVAVALAQLYLFPKSEYENHWRQEVWANLHEMKRLSTTKKLPSAKFIYDNSWDLMKNDTMQMFRYVIRKEHELTPRTNYSIVDFNNLAREYFLWIAAALSSYNKLTPDDVYDKLDELAL